MMDTDDGDEEIGMPLCSCCCCCSNDGKRDSALSSMALLACCLAPLDSCLAGCGCDAGESVALLVELDSSGDVAVVLPTDMIEEVVVTGGWSTTDDPMESRPAMVGVVVPLDAAAAETETETAADEDGAGSLDALATSPSVVVGVAGVVVAAANRE